MSILFILFAHIIILLIPLQARAEAFSSFEEGGLWYELDETTLKRGFPAKSFDSRFTLLIFPGILHGDTARVEVAPAPVYGATAAYRFRVTEGTKVPLVKKPFTIVFASDGEPLYARLYYYYAPQSLWLALTTIRDKARGILLSNRVDFAEAVVGMFVGDTPLPDTISAEAMSEVKAASLESQQEPFTAVLVDDILTREYTITLPKAALVIPSGAVSTPSTVTVFFDEEKRELDFAIKPHDPLVSPLSPLAFLEVIMDTPRQTHEEQKIVFWDNNTQSYRDLQTVESDGRVRAKTPFHFGRYTTVARPGVYRGEASWFRDSLLKTPFGAASNDYPKGARLRVTNISNSKSVEVEVRSTGPFVAGRVIDLTKTAFSKIANPKMGIIKVRVERVQ